MAASSCSTSSSLRFRAIADEPRRRPQKPAPALVQTKRRLTSASGVSGTRHGLNVRRPLTECRLAEVAHVSSCELTPPDGGNQEATGLKIGIVGFGNFGKFLAKALSKYGHTVIATSRTDYSEYCRNNGIQYIRSIDAFCEEQPDIIFICTSILSTESVLRSIPIHKLQRGTVFADVLSVKQFPRNLLLEVLPEEFGILCTHPMFGPESGKNGWGGLPFVYDKVRIAEDGVQDKKCNQFLRIFEQEGCRMVEMTCEEHDRHAAGSQFITHTIGRILSYLNLESTPINTKGYETLLQLTENTISDSFDLYYGLFMYNVNATAQIENLDRAFETVKQKLFGRLHDILRKQIVERVPFQGVSNSNRDVESPYFLLKSEEVKDLSSFAVPAEDKSELLGLTKDTAEVVQV
ncbi:arogenate dehydrogenase 2, chloroplastic-like [Nymphaea colorata]|nr:arogenate dehydrogenase 2, chloroplastic-like [Nymphaea colorata]